MAVHVFSALCSRVSIDRESNNVSLFEILEQVTLLTAPPSAPLGAVMHLEFLTLWMRSDMGTPEKFSAKVSIDSPAGSVMGGAEMIVDLTEFSRSRAKFKLDALPVYEPGVYWFRVSEQKDGQWSQVGSFPVEVRFDPDLPKSP